MFTSYAASFAAVWYVTETTGSAIILSVMSICAYLPQGILSPYGGVIADRYNRKTVVIIADMAVGLVSLMLGELILLGDVNIAAIMLYEGVGFHAVMFLDFIGAALACLALAKASFRPFMPRHLRTRSAILWPR